MARRHLPALSTEPIDLPVIVPVVEASCADAPIIAVGPEAVDLPIVAPVLEPRGAHAPVVAVGPEPVNLSIVAPVIESRGTDSTVVSITPVVRITPEARIERDRVEALTHALVPTLIDDAREDRRSDVWLLAHDHRAILAMDPVYSCK
jgi:hypothetical protein